MVPSELDEKLPRGWLMNRGRDLVGMPIINLTNGETVGRVKDVLFDPTSHQFVGIEMDGGGWLKGPRKIHFDDFAGIGEDAITILEDSVIMKALPCEESVITEDKVVGSRVLTKDGNELGTISDIIIDLTTGNITHYQISDGIIQDLLEGRGIVPIDTGITYGKDAIIVEMTLEQ